MWSYQEKTEQACRAARINRLVVNYQINQQLIWFDDRSESIFKKENAKKSRVCSVSVKANWISSWLWTVQDVWGRHRPDSLSINQENNQQCHRRWTEAVIRCCRTWSPHQNITIQTPVMRSDPLMSTQDEQRGADCLKTINNWLLTPSSSTHTSFAITLSVVSLSFVLIRAIAYTKKKKKKKSPHRCVQEVWSPSSHLSDVSMRVWSAAPAHSRTAPAIKTQGAFPSTGFQHFDPELLSFMPFR